MISLKDVALQRGKKRLFSNVDLSLHRGQRVGISGANGTGKSSLFQLLLGELQTDQGVLSLPPGLSIAHVAQQTPSVDRSAIDYVMDGDTTLREIEQAMAGAEGEKLADLHSRYDHIDGYSAKSRAGRLMHGLGFSEAQLAQPVMQFSGGWRMRLNLGQALMCRSDLLLLDEPTNHLDLEAVIWLEQWLRNYQGTLLLISHDREFLDSVVTHVVHIEHETLTRYTGNYSDFEAQRAEKLAQQQAAFEKQQRDIAHLNAYITRFRAKATKARQAQSRIKTLERMDKITAAHVDSPFHFQFFEVGRVGDPLKKVEGADIGYENKPVLTGVNIQIRPGARIGLLGPNGAGKSTLVKLLAEKLSPLAGEVTNGSGLKIGYFAQHQLEQLDSDASALQHLQRQDVKATEQVLRNFLGGFGFQGERADEPVAPFSGGEKSRLVLALLVWQRPNLLLLDEPTNHLDLEMRHALTLALQGYEGALVVVSHDRFLLRSCTDELYIVHNGKSAPYDGDLDDYRKYLAEAELALLETSETEAPAKADRRQQRREAAERRQQLQPITRKIRKLEEKMSPLQQQVTEIETALAQPEIYASEAKVQLKQLIAQQADIKSELELYELEWLALNEQLEQL